MIEYHLAYWWIRRKKLILQLIPEDIEAYLHDWNMKETWKKLEAPSLLALRSVKLSL